MQNRWLFSSDNIDFCKCQKADEKKKKVKRTSKIWKNEIRLIDNYRHSQAKCQLVQTIYIKRIELFFFLP